MIQDVSNDGRVILDGALTVRNAAAICATLRDTMERCPAVAIDCAAAAEVDLSFIQLLVAARASASRSGKTVTLAARPDGALLKAVTSAGFHIRNENTNGVRGFWFEGAVE